MSAENGYQWPGLPRAKDVRRLVFAAAAATVLAGPASAAPAVTTAREPWQTELIDLDGPDLVRQAFNNDLGRVRVLLTFSPT